MKVNKKFRKAVSNAKSDCKAAIIQSIVALIRECWKPSESSFEVVLKEPIHYLEMAMTRGQVNYTPRVAERISLADTWSERAECLAAVEGLDTFSVLEWLDIVTLSRVFDALLVTAKAE